MLIIRANEEPRSRGAAERCGRRQGRVLPAGQTELRAYLLERRELHLHYRRTTAERYRLLATSGTAFCGTERCLRVAL